MSVEGVSLSHLVGTYFQHRYAILFYIYARLFCVTVFPGSWCSEV